jgi:hypothetical protein
MALLIRDARMMTSDNLYGEKIYCKTQEKWKALLFIGQPSCTETITLTRTEPHLSNGTCI